MPIQPLNKGLLYMYDLGLELGHHWTYMYAELYTYGKNDWRETNNEDDNPHPRRRPHILGRRILWHQPAEQAGAGRGLRRHQDQCEDRLQRDRFGRKDVGSKQDRINQWQG